MLSGMVKPDQDNEKRPRIDQLWWESCCGGAWEPAKAFQHGHLVSVDVSRSKTLHSNTIKNAGTMTIVVQR
eukprot:1210527-Amphidinium_carterae.1